MSTSTISPPTSTKSGKAACDSAALRHNASPNEGTRPIRDKVEAPATSRVGVGNRCAGQKLANPRASGEVVTVSVNGGTAAVSLCTSMGVRHIQTVALHSSGPSCTSHDEEGGLPIWCFHTSAACRQPATDAGPACNGLSEAHAWHAEQAGQWAAAAKRLDKRVTQAVMADGRRHGRRLPTSEAMRTAEVGSDLRGAWLDRKQFVEPGSPGVGSLAANSCRA
eukprot:s1328_g20.t2